MGRNGPFAYGQGLVAGPVTFLVDYAIRCITFFAVLAASVLLTCDFIPSNHQKCRVLLIRFSLTHVVARIINKHSQHVKTIYPGAKHAIIIMTPA